MVLAMVYSVYCVCVIIVMASLFLDKALLHVCVTLPTLGRGWLKAAKCWSCLKLISLIIYAIRFTGFATPEYVCSSLWM